jgi:hypothetical protein
MTLAKLALACSLAAVSLCACGIAAKPLAGSSNLTHSAGNYATVDDPRAVHLGCLQQSGLPPIRQYWTSGAPPSGRLPAIQIGAPPAGPTAVFYPTPGAAQETQIINPAAQGAEVIGNALLYVTPQASDQELSKIEGCLAIDVVN